MEECDEVSAPEICFFAQGRAKLSAYDYNDEAESLDLFLLMRANPIASRVDARVASGFNYLHEFYNQCMKKKSPFKGEESGFDSDVQDAISMVREAGKNVSFIRFYILTDGAVSSNSLSVRNEEENGIVYEYHVWDITSIYRQDQIRQGNDKIEIDFENDIKYYVSSKNSKNNELIAPKIQCLKVEDDNPNVDSYLAIISGEVLAKIYNQYRTLILEKNVRAYLRNKSKVNKSIINTIKKTPEMFFSYNNGISTTASEVELKQNGRIQYITKLKDWQIVNGGQTTASIACATNCDLSKIFVEMKVSVVKDKEKYTEIVRSISKCANSQSAIKLSDFESGDKFLVELEKLSKEEIAPISNTKWFFERMRGQYTDTRASLSKLDENNFKNEYPKKQLLTKTDIAKVMTIWEQKPHIACYGREKCFSSYMTSLKKNQTNIDALYWHKIVALSILYKDIEVCFERRCAQNGFRSRTTTYTMAAISYLTNQQLDLTYIWKNEKVQPQLEEVIEREIVRINDYLDQDNSRSFTKKLNCWEGLKDYLDGQKVPISLQRQGDYNTDDYNDKERGIVNQANDIPMEWWKAMLVWAKKENFLSLIERRQASNFIKKIECNRYIKTVKAAEKAIALMEKAESLGFRFV